MRFYPEHDIGIGLNGLLVRRVEEDGSVITVRITPLKMSYRRAEKGREYSIDSWLSPKWLITLLYRALKKDFTLFFFWATFLASRRERKRESLTRKTHQEKCMSMGEVY